jgi:type I restriction enzyme, S subunit
VTWEMVALRDIGTWYGGGTPSKSHPEFWTGGSLPWLSPKDMGAAVLSGTRDKITPAAVENSAVKLVPSDAVAVVTRSGILERTLPVAFVPFQTTLNQDMKAVAPRPGVDPRWIALGLRAFERDLLRTTRKAGTTVASIEMSRLLRFELPVPGLGEQRRIISILEDHLSHLEAADEYVSVGERRLGALNRALLQRMVGGNSADRIQLGELVSRIEAGKSLGGAAAPARDGEWGIIKVSAMTWGKFRAEENKAISADQANAQYEIRPGDLLVSRANTSEYVGASVLVADEVRPRLLLSDKSLRLVPAAGVDRAWLWRVLQSPDVRSQISRLATGTKDSMRNISQKALLQVEVPRLDFAAQREAVTSYSLVEPRLQLLRSELEQARARSQGLRRAVLTAAFRGKLTGHRTDQDVVEELVVV